MKEKMINSEDRIKAREQMLEFFAEESRKAGMVRETQFVDIARFPLTVRSGTRNKLNASLFCCCRVLFSHPVRQLRQGDCRQVELSWPVPACRSLA